jgi:hypothetical protein
VLLLRRLETWGRTTLLDRVHASAAAPDAVLGGHQRDRSGRREAAMPPIELVVPVRASARGAHASRTAGYGGDDWTLALTGESWLGETMAITREIGAGGEPEKGTEPPTEEKMIRER